MSLTADYFAEFLRDGDEDEDLPLGDVLDELAVDIEVDSVEEVRELRERT